MPVDGLYIARKSDDVHPILFWFAFTTSTLGVIMAVVFLIFNIYHQNVR